MKKREKTIHLIAPGVGDNPPVVGPVRLAGLSSETLEKLSRVSPEGLSPSTARAVVAISPPAAPIVGMSPDTASKVAAASPAGVSEESLRTISQLSPEVQTLSSLTPQTAQLVGGVSAEGLSERTVAVLKEIEPSSDLRPTRRSKK